MGYSDFGYDSINPRCTQEYLMGPIVELMSLRKDDQVLDLGCGNGGIAGALLNKGFDVYGVDASITGIQKANQLFPGRFFVANFENQLLPAELDGKIFDCVISTEVIEHLYSPRSLLRVAKESLAPGGRLIITTPYHGYWKNLALAILGRLDKHFTVLWDGGHIKFFSRKTLCKMLAEEGFLPIDFIGIGRAPFLWKSMLIVAIKV